MAQIPRAALDYVTEQINGLSADAQAKVLKVLQALDWKSDDADNVAACRQAVVEALASIMPTYTDAAAQAGADLYDAVREASVGERLGAQSISGYNQDAVAGAVRAFVQDIVVGDMVEGFNRKVLDRVDYEVRRAENVSVAKNAARDPLKPKYARVPSGSETCGFCLMLSSFGFHYNSESSAGHAHANCDCRAVPDFGGASVEGYDPDEMYRNYNRCLETLGGRDGIREQWMNLPDDEREKRIERHGGKESDAFESFLNGRIAAEIETRDAGWFRTGKAPKVDYSDNPIDSYGKVVADGDYSPENIVDRGNEWRDLYAHHVLSENGFLVKTFDGKHIDITIDGTWWDVKSPESRGAKPRQGRELSFIENDVRKAIRQFDKRGMHDQTRIVYNPKYRHDASDAEMISELRRQMKGHGVKEALFITENGGIVRLKMQ